MVRLFSSHLMVQLTWCNLCESSRSQVMLTCRPSDIRNRTWFWQPVFTPVQNWAPWWGVASDDAHLHIGGVILHKIIHSNTFKWVWCRRLWLVQMTFQQKTGSSVFHLSFSPPTFYKNQSSLFVVVVQRNRLLHYFSMGPLKLEMTHIKVRSVLMEMQGEVKRDSFSPGFKHRLSLFNDPLAATAVSVIITVSPTFKQNLMLIFQTIVIIWKHPTWFLSRLIILLWLLSCSPQLLLLLVFSFQWNKNKAISVLWWTVNISRTTVYIFKIKLSTTANTDYNRDIVRLGLQRCH